MNENEWLDINEDWCGVEHLFRFEPDLVHGGAYLQDEKGRTWQIRTCAICGMRQKRAVDST